MRIICLCLLLGIGLSACSDDQPDLKSPCAGASGSPCDHRPVNDWWRS